MFIFQDRKYLMQMLVSCAPSLEARAQKVSVWKMIFQGIKYVEILWWI